MPELLSAEPEDTVVLTDWPVGPDQRAEVALTRHEIYSPEARIFTIAGKEFREVPRSRLRFLWGRAEDEDRTAVVVAVDPLSREMHGFSRIEGRWAEVRRGAPAESEYVLDLDPESAVTDATGAPPHWACADAPGVANSVFTEPAEEEPPAATAAVAALRRVTLAVDTDNELLSQKFANNTTSATNYIATLVALISGIYERDLQVRTLQGTTILRVSTTADPFVATDGSNAQRAQLDELKAWWAANQPGAPRAAVMMLSGKQSSANSASGIAFVNGLCSTNTGYSVSQVFKYSGSTASSDVKLVAHELGHNFGSPHTHCYSPPIDTCYAGEGGCYSGATSCPAATTINGVTNVRGTLMSYCHVLSGCSASAVFHPRTVERIAPIVQSKVGACVFDVSSVQEASPAEDLRAARGVSGAVSVTYGPACGASGHTVYAGNLSTLRTGGVAWTQRFCSVGNSGSASFNPGAGSWYFVVVGNSGTAEGSYGQGSSGERLPAGSGGSCSYTQVVGGSCP